MVGGVAARRRISLQCSPCLGHGCSLTYVGEEESEAAGGDGDGGCSQHWGGLCGRCDRSGGVVPPISGLAEIPEGSLHPGGQTHVPGFPAHLLSVAADGGAF